MKRLGVRQVAKALSVAFVIVVIFVSGFIFGTRWTYSNDFSVPVPGIPFDAVLDGDTIVDGGRAVHIEGLDAPELGPWAHCWAEAALAGIAKDRLEGILLEDRVWHIVDRRSDELGHATGRVIDKDGHDIADDMRVHGGSAMTSGHWDWCGHDAKLHDPLEGEVPPMGPNLWWPSGPMFDPRAAD